MKTIGNTITLEIFSLENHPNLETLQVCWADTNCNSIDRSKLNTQQAYFSSTYSGTNTYLGSGFQPLLAKPWFQ